MAMSMPPWGGGPRVDVSRPPLGPYEFSGPREYEQYMREYHMHLQQRKFSEQEVEQKYQALRPPPPPKKEEVINNAVLLLLEN